ncbi:hypothetical protein [Nonomuraea sp. NPDC049028]|uniref:hypothetical protein n=1 Tax=Nonomuraea sp. NPDC049028 TaxID=3364348 RepID=UPI00371276FB
MRMWLATPLLILAIASPASADPAPRKVDSDYTLLRSAPGSFVIGTAYKPWSVRIDGGRQTYTWARVGGNLNRCFWIFYNATTAGGHTMSKACGPAREYPSGEEFKRRFTNGMIGSNAQGNDGQPIKLRPHGACVAQNGKIDGWGNVEPWRTVSRPSHTLAGALTLGVDDAATNSRNTVKWRYVTRDGAYALIHATKYGKSNGKDHQAWFFIRRDCLPI